MVLSQKSGSALIRKRSSALDAHVGLRIRTHRKNAKLTLQVLADKLGIAYQQLQKYETGVNRVGAGRLMEIAEILDVPVASFFAVQEGAAQSALLTVGDSVGSNMDLALQGHVHADQRPREAQIGIVVCARLGGAREALRHRIRNLPPSLASGFSPPRRETAGTMRAF